MFIGNPTDNASPLSRFASLEGLPPDACISLPVTPRPLDGRRRLLQEMSTMANRATSLFSPSRIPDAVIREPLGSAHAAVCNALMHARQQLAEAPARAPRAVPPSGVTSCAIPSSREGVVSVAPAMSGVESSPPSYKEAMESGRAPAAASSSATTTSPYTPPGDAL